MPRVCVYIRGNMFLTSLRTLTWQVVNHPKFPSSSIINCPLIMVIPLINLTCTEDWLVGLPSPDQISPLMSIYWASLWLNLLLYAMQLQPNLSDILKGLLDRVSSIPLPLIFGLSLLCCWLANCLSTKCSLSNYCVLTGGSLVYWKAKKQTIVSKSYVEAEYRSMATVCCEITWVVCLLIVFDLIVALIQSFCDNKVAIHIASNPVFYETQAYWFGLSFGSWKTSAGSHYYSSCCFQSTDGWFVH